MNQNAMSKDDHAAKFAKLEAEIARLGEELNGGKEWRE